MMHTRRIGWPALLLACLATAAGADVRLPHLFGDHMVLQRDQALPVWGWAAPGESVIVTLGDAAPVTTTATAAGEWRVDLPARPAGGPLTLTVSGANTVTISDVLVGEVWLCSGQSNMEMTVASSNDAEAEIAAGDHPRIRQIKVPRTPAGFAADDFEGQWQVASPATVGSFTAAGYYMALELLRELDVPIGLINSSWGGTRIEPWTPPQGFAVDPELEPILTQVLLTDPTTPGYQMRLREYLTALETWTATAREALAAGRPLEPAPAYPPELVPLSDRQQPSTLYHGMIHPLIPYALRGAIWYQGEANHREGMLYAKKMRALIQGWRDLWGQGDFPFYFVQIAPFRYGDEPPHYLPEFWEAQAAAARDIRNSGLVITNDIGDIDDIHPKNKQDVGRRLALLALKHTYGKDVVAEGPTFRAMAIEGDRIRVTFDHVAGGLAARDGTALTGFEIIGAETDFVPANATIEGDSVVLSSPEVKQPLAVQFGWHKLAEPNLANSAGLPAVPFRAGEVPKRDYLALRVPQAKDYTLVYDLDLANLKADIVYDEDNSARIVGGFDRVGYFLELQKPGEPVQYVFVAMDAFTDDLSKIGIPTLASGAVFQQPVANLEVVSNVEGIANGSGLSGGNIEFWSHNYGPQNTAKVPNADNAVWDFGDQYSTPVDGYGCMQVHNHEAKQTIFAINQWKGASRADLGIGNSNLDPRTRDWTFSGNAGSYTVKRLRVLVRPKG